MGEAMEASMELMSNSFEVPQFSRLLERSREWWKGQNIKDKKDFVTKIPQIILFRHEAADKWQETLVKLRTLPAAKLSATFMEKLHCPKAVAESLTTLTEGVVLDQSELAKQEQALETISQEIGLATGTDAAQIKETILNAAGVAGADKPPATYKRASSNQAPQAPNISSAAPSEPPAEPPPSKKEKKKAPVAKKTLLEERPDRSRLATGVITGGVAVALLACSVYLWSQIGLNISHEASGVQGLSADLQTLLNDPDINRAVNGALAATGGNGTMAGVVEDVDKAKAQILGKYNQTTSYLERGGEWDNLLVELNPSADGKISNEQMRNFTGQSVALFKAGCLSSGYINIQVCENKYPKFKELDQQTKQDYAQKYNAFVDRVKVAYPSFFGGSLQPRNMERAPGREQQLRAFQAANAKRSNKEFRSTRRSMG